MNPRIEQARNVIFDVGKVLLTFEPEEYIPRLLQGEARQRVTADMLYGSPEWVALDGGTVTEEEVARAAARRAGDESLWPLVLPGVQRFPELMRPLPAARLIPALKAQGKGLYVLSNYGLEPFARTEKRFPEIFGQMDGMVISSREKVSKPDPAIYRLLLSRYGLQARDCAFIDDRADNVAAAEALGIAGILYTGEDVLK